MPERDESGFLIPGCRGGKTDWIVKAAADHVLANGTLKVAAASPERAEEVRDRVMEVVRDAVNKDWSA